MPRSTKKLLEIDCQLHYQVQAPTEFLFLIHALKGMDQKVVHERLAIEPGGRVAARHAYADPALGHRFLRVHADAGDFKLHYQARIERTVLPLPRRGQAVPIRELPDDILHNLMPTRYCESDLMARTAQKLFGHLPPGLETVRAIVDWIADNIDYRVGSTQSTTTACDVLLQRAGVCRDFAHLGITFCRALNIPARLVAGYAVFDEPPPDFHAMFEAYVGHRWLMFDATRMTRLDEVVRIASGRDAKDVAFATIFGPASLVSMAPEIRRLK